jgi:hypothetical protein
MLRMGDIRMRDNDGQPMAHPTGVRALLVAAGEQEDIRPFFA